MKIDVINDYFSKILKNFEDVEEIRSFSFDIEFVNKENNFYGEKRTYSLADRNLKI